MNRLKKKAAACLAALLGVTALSPHIYAGMWIEDEGSPDMLYYIGDDSYTEYKNGTFTIDGREYTFDENGICLDPPADPFAKKPADKAEWEETDEGRKCTVNGKKCGKGLHFIEGVMYRFDENGICKGIYSGWTVKKSERRYYNESGKPADRWAKIKGKYYYFLSNVYSGECFDSRFKISNIRAKSGKENTIEFEVENLTRRYAEHQPRFLLERLTGDKWETVPLSEDFGFEEIVLSAAPDSTGNEVMNIDRQYGTLPDGTYRINHNDEALSEPFTLKRKGKKYIIE